MIYALIYTILGSIFSTWFAFYYARQDEDYELTWKFWLVCWLLWPFALLFMCGAAFVFFCKELVYMAKAEKKRRFLKAVQDAFKQ